MKMTYDEIKQLILEYGDAREICGEYPSVRNAADAQDAQDLLLKAIKKILEDK